MIARRARAMLLPLAAFLVLSLLHTWPLAAAPSNWSRIDGDGGMNTWAVSWVAHALLTDPSRLFDANIFHPNKLTLAYSEAMLVQSMFALPVIAAGGSAILAYNVAVIAGFTLTGWAFCLLIRRWTGSWAAGYVAGSLAAFNAHTMVSFPHLQFLHAGFFAVMLFALDRLITAPRYRDACVLGVAFALQGMASLYLMAFAVFGLSFAALSRAGEWIRRSLPLLTRLAAAAAIALALLWPYLSPYRELQVTMAQTRSVDEAESASPANYAATGARVHYERWSREFGAGATSFMFPGFVALALVVLVISDPQRSRDPRVRMCGAAAVGCVVVSFAPSWPFYPALHAAIPMFQAVRAVHRVGQVALLMIAVLAGFGVAALGQQFGKSRAWPALMAAIVLLVNGEAMRAPMGYVWFDRVPAVYDVLAREPGAVIVEMPFPMPQQWFLNGLYMVNSTAHWRPMLNGYSSYRPSSYYESYEIMQRFPRDEALTALNALGVTHVVVHQKALNSGGTVGRYNPYESVPSLQLIARDDDVLIYRLAADGASSPAGEHLR
jgi:hypothetical protein